MSGVHPYIQTLIDAGDVAVYFDPRSGSYRDWGGNGNDGTPTGGRLSMYGYLTRDTSGVDVPFASGLNLGNGESCSTVALLSETFIPGNYPSPRFFDQQNGLISYISTGTSWIFQIGSVGSILVDLSGHFYRCFSNSWVAGEKPEFFADGVLKGVGNNNIPAADTTAKIVIANNTTGGIRPLQNNLAALMLFNRALTATEHALVYDALEHTSWPRLTYSHAPPRALAVCDDPGIVAAYNMRPVGGKIYDLTANRNDGAVVGPVHQSTPLGDALRFRGDGEYIEAPYIGTPTSFTASGWFNAVSQGESNFGRYFSIDGTNELHIQSSDTDLRLIYDNGTGANTWSLSGAYRQLVWQHVALVVTPVEIQVFIDGELFDSLSDTVILSASSMSIGNESSSGYLRAFDGQIGLFKFAEYAMTPDEIKAEYNRGAEALLFKTDWAARETAAPVTAGLVGGSPWEVISGSFDVVTVDYKGEPHKALKCVSAGVCAIPTSAFRVGPTQAASGGFRWVMSKSSPAGTLSVSFIANQKTIETAAGFDGYTYRFNATEQFQFIRFTNGGSFTKQLTAEAVIDLDTLYECRVDVEQGGIFSTYLGGVLIDPTGGIGVNPDTDTTFTDSAFIVVSANLGDMVLLGNRNGENGFQKLLGVPK
jgi:hypothetical protein